MNSRISKEVQAVKSIRYYLEEFSCLSQLFRAKQRVQSRSHWTGKEMRNLVKVILPCFAAFLCYPIAAERPIFTKSLTCLWSIVYFTLMSQYTSHTDETIQYLKQYLKAFHDHNDAFKEYLRDKSTARKAREVTASILDENTEILDQHPLAETTAAKRHHIADEQCRDLDGIIANIYDQDVNFHFVMIHLLSHFGTIYGALRTFKCILPSLGRQITKQWSRRAISGQIKAMRAIKYCEHISAKILRRSDVLSLGPDIGNIVFASCMSCASWVALRPHLRPELPSNPPLHPDLTSAHINVQMTLDVALSESLGPDAPPHQILHEAFGGHINSPPTSVWTLISEVHDL